MNICLFTKEELSKPLNARDERAQHLVKVLHKKIGDSFSAGIIDGPEGNAVITQIVPKGQPNAGDVSFTFTPEKDGKPLYPLAFIIGFPRPIQLKRLFRDAAGLGVSHLFLTGTELGEKSYLKSNLIQDGGAYRMLLDGTVQAAGTYIPQLSVFESLQECLDGIDTVNSILLAPDNVRPQCSITKFLQEHNPIDAQGNPVPVIAAIGSERGWTDNERMILEKKGFARCSMGIRILRTETAATVAGSIILSAMHII